MMGWRTLGVVRDGSGDSRRRPGWVGEPSERLGMGWETLGEVQDGLRRCGMGQGTLREVWEGGGTLAEVWDELGDSREGPVRVVGTSEPVGGPSGRFGTGRETLEER